MEKSKHVDWIEIKKQTQIARAFQVGCEITQLANHSPVIPFNKALETLATAQQGDGRWSGTKQYKPQFLRFRAKRQSQLAHHLVSVHIIQSEGYS